MSVGFVGRAVKTKDGRSHMQDEDVVRVISDGAARGFNCRWVVASRNSTQAEMARTNGSSPLSAIAERANSIASFRSLSPSGGSRSEMRRS